MRTLTALTLGALAATFAFAQTAASSGIGLKPFRPLGGNFFAWKTGQAKIVSQIGTAQNVRNGPKLVSFAKAVLRQTPLSARSAWVLGIGYEAGGDQDKARLAMQRAAMITRREARAQLWLANDALRRGNAKLALQHFDTVLRTNSAAAAQVLPNLAKILTIGPGREAMLPYANAHNPWFGGLMTGASALRDIAPMAEFLLARGNKAPDGDVERYAYSVMIQRLAAARRYDLLAKVYPLLPGADPHALQTLSIARPKGAQDYPPVAWDFGASNDRGGTPTALPDGGQRIEFFAAPGTWGASGTKLLAPGVKRTLRFRMVDREVNPEGTANWVATCLGARADEASTTSGDLTKATLGRELSFALPQGCRLLRLEMRMGGGLGRDLSRISVERLRLVQSS
jgi:hypothetical protein